MERKEKKKFFWRNKIKFHMKGTFGSGSGGHRRNWGRKTSKGNSMSEDTEVRRLNRYEDQETLKKRDRRWERTNVMEIMGSGATYHLSSLPCGPLHKAAWVSSRHGSWLSTESMFKERARWKLQFLYFSVLASEVTHHYFHNILW